MKSHINKLILASGAVILTIAGCAAPIPSRSRVAAADRNPGTEGMDVIGEALYEKNCSMCHGHFAVSTRRNISKTDLVNALTRPAMSSIKLTDYQIEAIVFALTDKIALKAQLPANADLANFDQGAVLYSQKCQVCHGAIDTSTKRNMPSTKINAALRSIAPMAVVSASPLEVELIAFALAHRRSEFTGTGLVEYRNVVSVVPQSLG